MYSKENNINNYTNTKLYSKLDISKQEEKTYYTKVVSAYENFIKFLSYKIISTGIIFNIKILFLF